MNSEQDKTMELLTATTPLDMEIQHMEPLDRVNGFDVRPGFYMFDGATPIPRGVCFTVQSRGSFLRTAPLSQEGVRALCGDSISGQL